MSDKGGMTVYRIIELVLETNTRGFQTANEIASRAFLDDRDGTVAVLEVFGITPPKCYTQLYIKNCLPAHKTLDKGIGVAQLRKEPPND